MVVFGVAHARIVWLCDCETVRLPACSVRAALTVVACDRAWVADREAAPLPVRRARGAPTGRAFWVGRVRGARYKGRCSSPTPSRLQYRHRPPAAARRRARGCGCGLRPAPAAGRRRRRSRVRHGPPENRKRGVECIIVLCGAGGASLPRIPAVAESGHGHGGGGYVCLHMTIIRLPPALAVARAFQQSGGSDPPPSKCRSIPAASS